MIISISGYAKSGKDTVGFIIQQLLSNVSENEILNHLEGKSLILTVDSKWYIKKWAALLKYITFLILNDSKALSDSQEDKNEKVSLIWNRYVVKRFLYEDENLQKLYVLDNYFGSLEEANKFRNDIGLDNTSEPMLESLTIRDFLQQIGTNALRNNFHPDIWVNSLLNSYDLNSKWIITDTRFKNELDAIRDLKGLTIKIKRNNKPVNAHISETDIDNESFDYIIENTGSYEELISKVKIILTKEKLLN